MPASDLHLYCKSFSFTLLTKLASVLNKFDSCLLCLFFVLLFFRAVQVVLCLIYFWLSFHVVPTIMFPKGSSGVLG